jgi:hypothetical protein
MISTRSPPPPPTPHPTPQFYVAISLMEGKSGREAVGAVHDKFVPTLQANYMVGPGGQGSMAGRRRRLQLVWGAASPPLLLPLAPVAHSALPTHPHTHPSAPFQLWPAANFINFRFVPPEQRILYVNAVYIGWVSFLVSRGRGGAGEAAGV